MSYKIKSKEKICLTKQSHKQNGPYTFWFKKVIHFRTPTRPHQVKYFCTGGGLARSCKVQKKFFEMFWFQEQGKDNPEKS